VCSLMGASGTDAPTTKGPASDERRLVAEKLDGNIARDRTTDARLRADGWTILRCWEHEDVSSVVARVAATLRDLQNQAGE